MTLQPSPSSGKTAVRPKLRVAIAGLGMGAVQIIRSMEQAPFLEVVAAADVRPQALEVFRQRYGGRTYESVDALCQDPNVDAIWIASPNSLHREHTITAARNGKHVVIEKPMAVTLPEAEAMVEAADRYGTKLLCGHTASLMAGFRAMRGVITSGELGEVRAVNVWAYTEYMFRPRMPQELVTELGGGAPYVMGPHQFDIVRLMGGGMVRSVRGMTGNWMPFRDGLGYYAAYLEFENGLPATVIHNGYGYFSTFEFVPWAGSSRFLKDGQQLRRDLRAGRPVDDAPSKEEMRFGGRNEGAMYGAPGEAEASHATGYQMDAGIVIVHCEKGDIRQGPEGLIVYDDDGVRHIAVEGIRDERMAELHELYDAIAEDRRPHHDGRWGLATLEVLLGVMQSGTERREIMMHRQCPAWE
ncbi:MAG: Gfo/Idh/MocA family oxidoreductase [Dehalococcoidia bacterium]|nr:Gfo/Idh/MocA family oxidoreductase [Dehalococcoidia bacterium]